MVRRSRFKTELGPAASADEARAFVERIRGADPGATHHCWAYLVGPPGSTAEVGCSDDGEPQGTAGQPMLTALLHSGLGDLVAVCTRHYGGVKLGTGGLARAYSGGVKRALAEAATALKVSRVPARVRVPYSAVDAVKRVAVELDVIIETERYGADAVFTCAVPERAWATLVRAVADATRGEGTVVGSGEAPDGV